MAFNMFIRIRKVSEDRLLVNHNYVLDFQLSNDRNKCKMFWAFGNSSKV